MANFLSSLVREKCPYCGKEDVFKKSVFLKIPEMHASCKACRSDFTGEPGYFFGAMYVSYAISVAIGAATFLVSRFALGVTSVPLTIAAIILMIVLVLFKNFKWSRIIWLKIFPPGANTNFNTGKEKNN